MQHSVILIFIVFLSSINISYSEESILSVTRLTEIKTTQSLSTIEDTPNCVKTKAILEFRKLDGYNEEIEKVREFCLPISQDYVSKVEKLEGGKTSVMLKSDLIIHDITFPKSSQITFISKEFHKISTSKSISVNGYELEGSEVFLRADGKVRLGRLNKISSLDDLSLPKGSIVVFNPDQTLNYALSGGKVLKGDISEEINADIISKNLLKKVDLEKLYDNEGRIEVEVKSSRNFYNNDVASFITENGLFYAYLEEMSYDCVPVCDSEPCFVKAVYKLIDHLPMYNTTIFFGLEGLYNKKLVEPFDYKTLPQVTSIPKSFFYIEANTDNPRIKKLEFSHATDTDYEQLLSGKFQIQDSMILVDQLFSLTIFLDGLRLDGAVFVGALKINGGKAYIFSELFYETPFYFKMIILEDSAWKSISAQRMYPIIC